MAHRAKLDGNVDLKHLADTIVRVGWAHTAVADAARLVKETECVRLVESGVMTKDLSLIIHGKK